MEHLALSAAAHAGIRVAATAVVATLAFAFPSVSLAAGDANAHQCGMGTESSPGFRAYLPDCRAYELVTPPYKGGAVVLNEGGAISGDGAHVITGAGGAFAGAGNLWANENRNPSLDVYELTRAGTGWVTTALTPPATIYPHGAIMAANLQAGTTLWSLATSNLVFNEGIYLRDEGGEFLPVGPGVGPEVASEALRGQEEELDFAGASYDLTHALFQVSAFTASVRSEEHRGHNNLWPGDTTEPGGTSLYEYVYAGAPTREPTLVGVKNDQALKSDAEALLVSRCGTELGTSETGGSAYNAVSSGGETVFFTALHAGREGQECATPAVNELYARISGEKTVAISEPLLPAGECTSGHACFEAAPKEGIFQGASRDGSKVFFLTEQPLLNGDADTTTDLYEAEIEGEGTNAKVRKLVMVSAGEASAGSPGAERAEVQGVVRVSEDGSHIYFVAKGVLTSENGEKRSPEAGADNLYVYDTMTEKTAFVATLLNGAEESGIAAAESAEVPQIEAEALRKYEIQSATIESEREHGEISSEQAKELLKEAEEAFEAFILHTTGTLGPSGTLAEDRSVWGLADERPAQATPDGRFLVFVSSANLTADDRSHLVPQLFEYDATQAKLTRVSIGEDGSFANGGNVDTFARAPRIPAQSFHLTDLPTAAEGRLAISADGSKVFFTSAAGLTPQAIPGSTSVYEYQDGNVYLLSGGRDSSETTNRPTVELFGVDPSGKDALFLTAEQLVPQDGETQMALYDAREEGGFPAPTLVPGCSGETCRGASGSAPQLGLPGTAGQAGGGNLPPPVESKPAGRSTPKSLTRAQRLAKALRACRAMRGQTKRGKQRRASCERGARNRFGIKARAKRSGWKAEEVGPHWKAG